MGGMNPEHNADCDALERLSELLHPWLDGTPHCPWESPGFCPNTRRSQMAAEALLPVLADVWTQGARKTSQYSAGFDLRLLNPYSTRPTPPGAPS